MQIAELGEYSPGKLKETKTANFIQKTSYQFFLAFLFRSVNCSATSITITNSFLFRISKNGTGSVPDDCFNYRYHHGGRSGVGYPHAQESGRDHEGKHDVVRAAKTQFSRKLFWSHRHSYLVPISLRRESEILLCRPEFSTAMAIMRPPMKRKLMAFM